MTRGMKGCYVYFTDKETEKYFKSRLKKDQEKENISSIIKSPYIAEFEMVSLPLFESVGCGELMYADPMFKK